MGSWETLGPALLSLAGVALGGIGALFGQYLVSRAATRQSEVQQSASHRAELKAVVLKFLRIARHVEKAALARMDTGDTAQGQALDGLVTDLWLAQMEVDLAARTESLRGAAYRYASRIDELSRSEAADTSALHLALAQLMEAAYDDLWPGQRRTTEGSVATR